MKIKLGDNTEFEISNIQERLCLDGEGYMGTDTFLTMTLKDKTIKLADIASAMTAKNCGVIVAVKSSGDTVTYKDFIKLGEVTRLETDYESSFTAILRKA